MRKVVIASALVSVLALQTPIAAVAQDWRRPPGDSRYDRRPPPPPGWGDRQWNYRQDYLRRHEDRRDDHSDAIIAGLLGFALGAAIAGSHEDKARVEGRLDDPNWTAYCSRRYRSFDPHSGTYLGYDGLRRYCR